MNTGNISVMRSVIEWKCSHQPKNKLNHKIQPSRVFSTSSASIDTYKKPLVKFQEAVKTILTLNKATNKTSHHGDDSKLLSFAQYQNDILRSKMSSYGGGLVFDPLYYRSQKEIPLSNEAKAILSSDPEKRTNDQLHIALLATQTAVEAFCEFPINMQKSIIKVGRYEHFGPKRVIIRQGHTADNFYFILSGTAIVTVLETNKRTKETYSRTLALLGKGNSFGELALMHAAKRSATVTCQNHVGLLAVSREDFIDIFMHAESDKEPEHITYLRSVEQMIGWPVDKLPWNDPTVCLFTYFRRGTVMCKDSNQSDWIYFIKSGACRVLKGLNVNCCQSRQTEQKPGSANAAYSPFSHYKHSLSRSKTLTTLLKQEKDIKILEDHKHRLNEIAKSTTERHMKKLGFHEDKINKEKHQQLFVQVHRLGPQDTFGLEHVALSIIGECSSVSLVSDGAEAVLINKKFFLQYLTDQLLKKIRKSIRPYPDEYSMERKLRDRRQWEKFKATTIHEQVMFSKVMKQVSSLYF